MSIKVSQTQKESPIIRLIGIHKPVMNCNTVYDYEPNEYFGVFVLSLRMHNDVPNYIFERIERIKTECPKKEKVVIILLINTDLKIKSMNESFIRIQYESMHLGVQVVPAYSYEECSRYITSMYLQKEGTKALRNYNYTTKQKNGSRKEEGTPLRKKSFWSAVEKLTEKDSEYLATMSIKEITDQVLSNRFKAKGFGKKKIESLKLFIKEGFRWE